MEHDYIADLSEGEKVLFLQAVFNLICADKKVEQNEKDFIKRLSARYNLPSRLYPQILQVFPREEIVKRINAIPDKRKKYALLIELFMVANIDDELASEEIEYILDFAEALDVPYMKVETINQYTKDYIKNQETYRKIMDSL